MTKHDWQKITTGSVTYNYVSGDLITREGDAVVVDSNYVDDREKPEVDKEDRVPQSAGQDSASTSSRLFVENCLYRLVEGRVREVKAVGNTKKMIREIRYLFLDFYFCLLL